MSGGKQTTETKTATDPALLALYTKNDAKANEVADSIQYSPYSGERVAGLTPTQIAGQGGILSAVNDPTGTNALRASQQTTGGLLDYRPPTITAPNTVTAGQLSNTDLAPYMNPFQKQVIDASIAQNEFARDQQGAADNATATAAHAFGGTRQAVQRANTTGAYDRNDQQNLADLNNQNFTQARSGAQFDIGNRFAADQFNATGGYNANVANAANDITGANFRLNAANSNGILGDALLTDQVKRQGLVYGVGQQQQQQQQAQDDAAYEEFLRQLNTPLIAQQVRNQSLGMIPMQSTTTSNTTQKGDLFGGILGAIAGGAQVGQKLYGG